MLLFRCHFGKSTSTATKKHAADRRRKGKNADGEKEEERKCRQCELVNSTSTLREYGKGCCSVLVVFWCRNHTKMCWWEESLQRLHQICMQCQLKSSHIECEVLVCASVCMKNVNYVSLNSRQSSRDNRDNPHSGQLWMYSVLLNWSKKKKKEVLFQLQMRLLESSLCIVYRRFAHLVGAKKHYYHGAAPHRIERQADGRIMRMWFDFYLFSSSIFKARGAMYGKVNIPSMQRVAFASRRTLVLTTAKP